MINSPRPAAHAKEHQQGNPQTPPRRGWARRGRDPRHQQLLLTCTLGEHFIEKVTAVDSTLLEGHGDEGQTPLSDTKFQSTIRGWDDKAQQHRATLLLTMTNSRRTALIQKEKHILLIPREWWPKKIYTLTPQESGWWYTISGETSFHECGTCEKRIGGDLHKDTKPDHSRDCTGARH